MTLAVDQLVLEPALDEGHLPGERRGEEITPSWVDVGEHPGADDAHPVAAEVRQAEEILADFGDRVRTRRAHWLIFGDGNFVREYLPVYLRRAADLDRRLVVVDQANGLEQVGGTHHIVLEDREGRRERGPDIGVRREMKDQVGPHLPQRGEHRLARVVR